MRTLKSGRSAAFVCVKFAANLWQVPDRDTAVWHASKGHIGLERRMTVKGTEKELSKSSTPVIFPTTQEEWFNRNCIGGIMGPVDGAGRNTADATTLLDLQSLVNRFVSERAWEQFHTPKNVSMALAIEAAELMNLFKWYTGEDSIKLMRHSLVRNAATDEVADILIYCLAFGSRTGIDLARAVKRKIVKNRRKYPARKFKGRF
jgi:NTP pyrophosphatase (non-canonical NTP hydrolase)